MAGHVMKRRRLANAGRRRTMTAKQIRFFGSKRQKAALKNRRRRNVAHPRRRNQGGVVSQLERSAERAIGSIEDAAEKAIAAVQRRTSNPARRRNVGEILTVLPGANPGRRRRRKTMARTRN